MKKLLVLFALAAMVLGAAGLANALDVKAKGSFEANYNYWSNKDFTESYSGNNQMKHSELVQRARIYMDFRANENVNFQLGLEIGDTFWGNDNSDEGGEIGADGKIVEVKRAYMEFKWPTYKSLITTVGIQGAVFPSSGYFGSAIFDDDIAGVTLANKWNDMVSTVFGLYRASDNDFAQSPSNNRLAGDGRGILDVALLAAPLTFDGFKLSPFFSMAFMGKNAPGTYLTPSNNNLLTSARGGAREDQANPWWAGAGFEVSVLDPFAIYADFNYGSIDQKDAKADVKGWLGDLAIEYKGLSFMTPSVYGWYSSGLSDDANDGDGRMPVISEGWGVGSDLLTGARMLSSDIDLPVVGSWGIGLQLAKISFLQDLSHDIVFYYAQGTNDKKSATTLGSATYGVGMTEEDHIIGVDLNNTYKIMEELSFMVDLGFGIPDLDKDTWRPVVGSRVDHQQTLYRTSVGMIYKF